MKTARPGQHATRASASGETGLLRAWRVVTLHARARWAMPCNGMPGPGSWHANACPPTPGHTVRAVVVLSHTWTCHAMPCHTCIACYARSCHATPRHANLCCAMCGTADGNAVERHTLPNHAMSCHAMSCHATHCISMHLSIWGAMACHAMPGSRHAAPWPAISIGWQCACLPMACHAMPCVFVAPCSEC